MMTTRQTICPQALNVLRAIPGAWWQNVNPSQHLDTLEGLGLIRVIVFDNELRAKRQPAGDEWIAKQPWKLREVAKTVRRMGTCT